MTEYSHSLVLLETAHGHRYYRIATDPMSENDHRRKVIPFACNHDEDPDDLAAVVAANYNMDLEDTETWIFDFTR